MCQHLRLVQGYTPSPFFDRKTDRELYIIALEPAACFSLEELC